MAVRFDADGEDYTRALALGTQAALTVTCWLKISVNRATWSTPWSIDNGAGDNWLIQTGTDGVTLGTVFDATSQQNMGALTVGTWYFVALAMNGSNGFLYHKTAATGLSTVTVDGGTASVNAATLRIGESPWGGEWWNGCIAAMKVWTAQLSAAEVANEAAQYQPRRVANLVAYYPLVRPETTDYSGNARTLTGGTGTTREDGPPLPWEITSPRLILPPAGGGALTLTDTPAGTRAGSSVGTLAAGKTLADTTSAVAAATTVDTVAAGIALADTATASRAGGTTGETATTALVLTDPASGGTRAATTSAVVVVDVVHNDTPVGAQGAATADTLAVGKVLADTVSGARQGNLVGEAAVTALVVLDPGTGQVRLGGVFGEAAATGSGVNDPAAGGIRAAPTADTLTFGLVLADTASGTRAAPTVATLTLSMVLADRAGAAAAATTRDTVLAAGPVTRGSIEPADRATTHMAPTGRDAAAMAHTDRTISTMGG